MTTPTSTPTTRPPNRTPAPASLRIAGNLASDLFFYGLFWGGIVLLVIVVNLAANGIFGDGVDRSFVANSTIMIRYVVMVGGIILVTGYLALYVAHGMTRRNFFTGAVVAGFALVPVVAALTVALFWLEGLVFDAADWPHLLDEADQRNLLTSPDAYGTIFGVMVGILAGHLVTGLLIGATYCRLGGGGCTVLLPVTLLPAVVSEFALSDGITGWAVGSGFDLGYPDAPLASLICVAVVLAGLAAAFAVVRDMPVSSEHVVWWR